MKHIEICWQVTRI